MNVGMFHTDYTRNIFVRIPSNINESILSYFTEKSSTFLAMSWDILILPWQMKIIKFLTMKMQRREKSWGKNSISQKIYFSSSGEVSFFARIGV